jgi:DNA adenine methylase
MNSQSTIASPFFGGGSIELELAARGHNVIATDDFYPVAMFWQQLKESPQALHAAVSEFLPGLSREEFKALQQELRQLNNNLGDPLRTATVFFVLNRCSFSGSTLSGGMSPGCARFTEASVDRLLVVDMSRVDVRHGDYWDQLLDPALGERWDAIYADPPYCLDKGSKLYGDRGDRHSGFDHQLFAQRMAEVN